MLTGEIQPVLGGEAVERVDGGALGNSELLNLAEIDGLRVESDILDGLEMFALRMDFSSKSMRMRLCALRVSSRAEVLCGDDCCSQYSTRSE